jgi:hypothetical protein
LRQHLGENDAAVGCLLRDGPRGFESAPSPVEPGCPVRLRALHPLDVPLGEQALDP